MCVDNLDTGLLADTEVMKNGSSCEKRHPDMPMPCTPGAVARVAGQVSGGGGRAKNLHKNKPLWTLYVVPQPGTSSWEPKILGVLRLSLD